MAPWALCITAISLWIDQSKEGNGGYCLGPLQYGVYYWSPGMSYFLTWFAIISLAVLNIMHIQLKFCKPKEGKNELIPAIDHKRHEHDPTQDDYELHTLQNEYMTFK